MQFTIECGTDSITYPLYFNGIWVVNITLPAVPTMYKIDVLEQDQIEYYTSYIKYLIFVIYLIETLDIYLQNLPDIWTSWNVC